MTNKIETKTPNTPDEYIAQFPFETQVILNKFRAIIKESVPNAKENISYGMPAFKLNGKPLVYFGGYKNHIGFYALPSGNTAFKEDLSIYKTGKGSIQFPLNEEMPWTLIEKIVKFRQLEVLSTTKD